MQRCFLVVNKEIQIASYLQHRSIMEVTEEHRSLAELNLEKLEIVDVDKLLYIYYQTDDADLSFRADMNTLRVLLSSAFFHVSEALFILVNNENPLLEDLVYSALRDSSLTRDKIEIVQHSGSLMLSDIGKYVSGSAVGQSTTSTYRDVFIREADTEEKERYLNKPSDIGSVLPVLTDMAALYAQRASVEAISAGRTVSERLIRPQIISDFSKAVMPSSIAMGAFVVSGERWTGAERAAGYLAQYYRVVGQRCLLVNLNPGLIMENIPRECTLLTLMDIKNPITPECPTAMINARFDQLGYIIELIRNIKGVEQYVFNVAPGNYKTMCQLIPQLYEVVHTIYIAHYNPVSVQEYVDSGLHSTAVFLSFEHFKKDFNLQAYKKDFKDTLVAIFPTEDVDYTEFYSYATGGGRDD